MADFFSFATPGQIGDFEVGAKWQWKVQLHTVSVFLLAVAVALLFFLAAGCIHLGMQFAELSRARSEIQQARSDVFNVHSAMQVELSKLKEELAYLQMQLTDESSEEYLNSTDNLFRERRSIAKAGKGGKSKESKYLRQKKMDNSTSYKSSALKHHSKHSDGIFSFGIFGLSHFIIFLSYLCYLNFHFCLNIFFKLIFY